ncbi:MAG: methyltransferase domain-containing protein [Ruminococcaceae bacterium]|nr:methyltransferase domain-containing protein [Oscillospiraceae bacterium]
MKLTDEVLLCEDESVEDLGNSFRIIQGQNEFRFGTDAVKLSDFAVVHSGDQVMDLCTGTGIVPILLHAKQPCARIVGLEIQEQMAAMAQRSVKLNSLTDKIEIVQGDVKKVRELFEAESFQVVTCNPPYMKNNTGKQNVKDSVTIARHEILCDLADCVEAASYLLPSGGRFYMVHRPERLCDIMAVMRAKNIEPKRLTLYAFGKNKPPRLLVIEGQKNRNSGLIVQIDAGDLI